MFLCAAQPTSIPTIVGHWQSSSEIRTNLSPCPSCFPVILSTMLLSSSHRHGRARRAPWFALQMSSAQMFHVHIIHTTITSIDRTMCEQSRENMLSLAADEVIQTTRTFESHISSWSFQHSKAFRTSLIEISIISPLAAPKRLD